MIDLGSRLFHVAPRMTSLPRALALSIGQLGDRAILCVLAKSAVLTLAIFAALGAALWWALDAAIEEWIVAILPGDYSDGLAGLLALALGVIAAWFLFRVVALAVIQLFADEIVRAVEARHYPSAAANARDLSLGEDVANGARGAGRAVLFNLVALPFALALLITGVGTALLFWFVNALLLGRELTEMVAVRHRPRGDEEALPVGGITRFLLGGVVAALLAIPFLNLLAPVIGAASATHLIHGRARHAPV